MISINTKIPSLSAQRSLRRNQDNLGVSLDRLSTGLRINHGGDDPAGLVAAETLRAERLGFDQGVRNAARASNVVGTAEGGLSEVSDRLTEVQSLVSAAANGGAIGADEAAASLQQLDTLLSEINRVSAQTSSEGKRLMNGALDYQTSGVTANVNDLPVNAIPQAGGAPTLLTMQEACTPPTLFEIEAAFNAPPGVGACGG